MKMGDNKDEGGRKPPNQTEVDSKAELDPKKTEIEPKTEIELKAEMDVTNNNNEIKQENNGPLSDEERMLLYEKALQFKRLGSLNHALLSFLGCLQGLQPSRKSKFTLLPQCLTHIAEIYAYLEDFQKAVEFMQAAKLYYETAIIEAGRTSILFSILYYETTLRR